MRKIRTTGRNNRIIAVTLALAMALSVIVPGRIISVSATGTASDSSTASGSNVSTSGNATNNILTGTNTDPNGTLGKNSDVGVEVTESIKGVAGKEVTVSFKLVSGNTNTIKIKSVYPVIDTTFPFETSGDAYKIIYAGDDEKKQLSLDAAYTLKARSDLEDGYQSVKFIGEYSKFAADGSSADFYVIKTINIYFSATEPTTATTQSSTSKKSSSKTTEKSTQSSSNDNDDDDSGSSYSGYSGGSSSSGSDEETAPPKLIIKGFDTEPKKVMAGDSFKMKIHVMNSSEKTNVCNGKFLIGDEAGNFLPTSGSNAVFVEKIEAGQTGDIEIELKTSADLPQKNYRLMIKGDFDDGNGDNFSASESVYLTVYQEVKMNVTDVTMTPESIGIGTSGSLVFTINNQSSAGVYNISVSTSDDAVSAVESYVGNIAANSSAYATLEVTGKQDNSDRGTIKVKISYEDSDGTKGEIEQDVPCLVGVDAYSDYDYDDFEEYEEEEDTEIPWWIWLIIGIAAVAAITVIVVIIVKKRKKKLAKLMEEEDASDLFDDEAKMTEGAEASGDSESAGSFDDSSNDISKNDNSLEDSFVSSETEQTEVFGEDDITIEDKE